MQRIYLFCSLFEQLQVCNEYQAHNFRMSLLRIAKGKVCTHLKPDCLVFLLASTCMGAVVLHRHRVCLEVVAFTVSIYLAQSVYCIKYAVS